ncbi:hypothetical protein FACS1894219_12620 [Clostridia bacterium]|nr:hypothetical protein FACS1894219_12620 [Clostridia bacterium]
MTGYESIYNGLLPRLRGLDFSEAAERLGLTLISPDIIRMRFIGSEYEIRRGEIVSLDPEAYTNVNFLSVAAYYVLSGGSKAQTGEFLPLRSFSEIKLSGAMSNVDWMSDPLCREYSGDDNLAAAAVSLGGISVGEAEWEFAVLPKVSMRLRFIPADDEFPCETKISFSSNAGNYLEFECLAFLQGCFVKAMCEKMRVIKNFTPSS